MARATGLMGPNMGNRFAKMERLRLSDVAAATTTDAVEIIVGDGVPSGGYGMPAAATGLYFRKDAAAVGTAMYVTVNGGTNWTAFDPATVAGASLTVNDTFALQFGTPGTDLVLTSDGTDVIVTSTGDLVFNDSVDVKFGTGKDIGIAWDGVSLKVTQAAPNSAIELGVDGAGIDLVLLGDTASASAIWDQSADSLVFSGVAKLKLQTIAAATATPIPVTHSGSFPVTTAAAETNTLADPTYLGQTISIFCDTYAVGNRVITAASRINEAGNTIITLGAAGDFIKLEAITIGGALKWQVVSNDGAALS